MAEGIGTMLAKCSETSSGHGAVDILSKDLAERRVPLGWSHFRTPNSLQTPAGQWENGENGRISTPPPAFPRRQKSKEALNGALVRALDFFLYSITSNDEAGTFSTLRSTTAHLLFHTNNHSRPSARINRILTCNFFLQAHPSIIKYHLGIDSHYDQTDTSLDGAGDHLLRQIRISQGSPSTNDNPLKASMGAGATFDFLSRVCNRVQKHSCTSAYCLRKFKMANGRMSDEPVCRFYYDRKLHPFAVLTKEIYQGNLPKRAKEPALGSL